MSLYPALRDYMVRECQPFFEAKMKKKSLNVIL